MSKPFARQFYSSAAWQACRNEYAKKQGYLCENCLRQGIYKPGEIVHHKIELDPVNIENPEITLNPANLMLLCRDCHAKVHDIKGKWDTVNKKKRERKQKELRYVIADNGAVAPNERVTHE